MIVLKLYEYNMNLIHGGGGALLFYGFEFVMILTLTGIEVDRLPGRSTWRTHLFKASLSQRVVEINRERRKANF